MPMLTYLGAGRAFAALASAATSFARGTAAGASVVLRWLERAEQRRRLAEMNDHMLRDIGLDRSRVWHETTKPFWRG
jgi:uncharacterized protein YjiS (DUF1127 family)